MSTIHVNYRTKLCNAFLKNQTVQTSSEKSMADMISDNYAEAEKTETVTGALQTEAVSTKDMTMEEYKAYISDKISQMSMNPSRMQDSISIHISEAGFEAMKNDSEYEEWALEYLEKDFMCDNPWTSVCGGSYVVYNFGASKEEFHAEGWYAGYQNGSGEKLYSEKSQNSFWERRAENKKRLEKQMGKREEQKRIREKMEESAAYIKRIVAASQAVSSYEASFMVMKDFVR